ncbi:hypothetical protein FGRMN_1267 [Fusarium graminum]|nr:hypothetical protein FGRMN_1267 [Fusarium graminum]
MDPFNKLPPELHLRVLLAIRCRNSVSCLTQASPIMRQQYFAHKAYLEKKLLASDFGEAGIQDAIAILLFPVPACSVSAVSQHLRSWSKGQLPDPFESNNEQLLRELIRLHGFLLMFIEDYITKAIATDPSREYLCLPTLSLDRERSFFREEDVFVPFDSTHLTSSEMQRFMRAFLRYELDCKVHVATILFQQTVKLSLKRHFKRRKLNELEHEAIMCVESYVQSLYGAMIAQCGDAWLPTSPENSSTEKGLLFPDSFYMDPEAYGSDLGLGDIGGATIANRLSDFGLDLAAELLCIFKDKNVHKVELKRFFVKISNSDLYEFITGMGHLESDILEDPECQQPTGLDAPMYHRLRGRLCRGGLLTKIYRRRAWVFFDNDRLYPRRRASRQTFPTERFLIKQRSTVTYVDGRFLNPKPTEALHRSQAWHDGFADESPEAVSPATLPGSVPVGYLWTILKNGRQTIKMDPFWKKTNKPCDVGSLVVCFPLPYRQASHEIAGSAFTLAAVDPLPGGPPLTRARYIQNVDFAASQWGRSHAEQRTERK